MSFSGVSLENREKLHSPFHPFAELVPFCCALLCNSRQHSTKASTWPCRRDSLSGEWRRLLLHESDNRHISCGRSISPSQWSMRRRENHSSGSAILKFTPSVALRPYPRFPRHIR